MHKLMSSVPRAYDTTTLPGRGRFSVGFCMIAVCHLHPTDVTLSQKTTPIQSKLYLNFLFLFSPFPVFVSGVCSVRAVIVPNFFPMLVARFTAASQLDLTHSLWLPQARSIGTPPPPPCRGLELAWYAAPDPARKPRHTRVLVVVDSRISLPTGYTPSDWDVLNTMGRPLIEVARDRTLSSFADRIEAGPDTQVVIIAAGGDDAREDHTHDALNMLRHMAQASAFATIDVNGALRARGVTATYAVFADTERRGRELDDVGRRQFVLATLETVDQMREETTFVDTT